jgi:hypothetical protein
MRVRPALALTSVLTSALGLLAACSSEDGTRTVHADAGRLCAAAPGVELGFGEPPARSSYPADTALTIAVWLPGECLSSSCDTERKLDCSVTRDGDRLVVRSELAWTSFGGACTADCGLPLARCQTPPLPAGDYVIVHGTRTASLSVGAGEGPTACAGP